MMAAVQYVAHHTHLGPDHVGYELVNLPRKWRTTGAINVIGGQRNSAPCLIENVVPTKRDSRGRVIMSGLVKLYV